VRTTQRPLAGFTLFDALVGVALAAIAARAGLMQLAALTTRVRLLGAAHQVAATLRDARSRAIAYGETVTVRIDPIAAALEARGTRSPTLRATLPPGVTFQARTPPRHLTFSALGTTENDSFVLVAGSGRRRIVTNQRGRIRLG
jgi:Tfp pilus assembly protein FimT